MRTTTRLRASLAVAVEDGRDQSEMGDRRTVVEVRAQAARRRGEDLRQPGR
jgi:hypothetical protein